MSFTDAPAGAPEGEPDATQKMTIETNYWRIPSKEGAFSGFVEGRLTDEDRLRVIQEAEAARKVWKPTAEALQLIADLKAFVGCRVRLQFWDSIMMWNEIEGPFPCDVDLIGVVVLQVDGFPQAFLKVSNVIEVPNEHGYSAKSYFQQRPECLHLLAAVADLYEICKLGDKTAL
jgi:hypothetical protein